MNSAGRWQSSVIRGSNGTSDLEKKTAGAKRSVKSEDAILGTDSQSLTKSVSQTGVLSNTATSQATVLLIPSAFLRLNPKVTDSKQQAQNSAVAMAIKREHNNNNSSSNYSDSSTFTGDDDDDSSNDSFGSKFARTDVAVDYSLSSSVGTKLSTGNSNGPRRHTGPRKPRVHEKLSPAEEERRQVRRERNKHAAAKCRQKRVDLTNQLLAETEKLESEQAKLHADIKGFQQEKEELEFILQAHRLHCGIAKDNSALTSTILATSLDTAKSDLQDSVVSLESLVVPAASVAKPVASISCTAPSTAIKRPNTLATRLPIDIATSSATSSGSNQIAGIAITTPSAGLNVFTLGLESMMDGHTGLTPITGLPLTFSGLSTPLMIAGLSGNHILLTGGNQSQQNGACETVLTPVKTEASTDELL